MLERQGRGVMVVEPIRKPIGVRIPLNHSSVGGAHGIRVTG